MSRDKSKVSGQFLPHPWTEEDEEKFCALYPITASKKLAEMFGLAHGTVNQWAHNRGLKKSPGGTGRAVPIGSKHKDKKGYVWIKVAMYDWRKEYILLWEGINGPVPKGFRIRFKDGNKENCAIENLEMVSDAEHMKTHSTARFPPELRSAIATLSKLKRLIDEKSN